MDTALEAEEGSEGLEVACLIETCECPAGYAGLSCQVRQIFTPKTTPFIMYYYLLCFESII